MKKLWYFTIFLFMAGLSFAQSPSSRNIYIEGTATNQAQRTFFLDNFRMEGGSLGYNIVDNREEAAYIFRFAVAPNMITYDDGSRLPAPPDEAQFAIMISLIRNSDDYEVASFGFAFSTLDEMYEFNLYLFFRAVVNIPLAEFDPYLAETTEEQTIQEEDNTWRNQWLYLRASIDYPIRFYLLRESDDLIGGRGVYNNSPSRVSPLDHRFVALPGFTLGAELQFLEGMIFGPFFQLSMGDPENALFTNLSAGALFRYNYNGIRDIVLSPYAALTFPVNKSPVFNTIPFSAGLGFQVGLRAGNTGLVFLDLSFMHAVSNAVMFNQYGELFPNPPTISYRHFAVGIGFGYKHGFMTRD